MRHPGFNAQFVSQGK